MNPLRSASPLCTDLYELTMAAGYFAQGMDTPATFSLYLRSHPRRGYFVAAGLGPLLDGLEQWSFEASDIDYLDTTGLFDRRFLSYLRDLRFGGTVRALPEGTIFFPDEPILEITAPLIQAQLVETFIINTMGVHTLMATKAARCNHAARGRGLIDFALRRTQGQHAGMAAARSSYIAGFDATSNVLAGQQYGIPIAGTMAHAFVQAFEDELAAFRAYAQTFPQRAIFLIDTYDTLEGARRAAAVGREMAVGGNQLIGVRLDSGDMVAQSRQVRNILDDAGLTGVKIFVSGGYDEYGIADALDREAAIDAFGVGTRMGVSADAPYLDLVYKLVRHDGRDVRKHSAGKQTLAGEKQVLRHFDSRGRMTGDVIATRGETVRDAVGLMTRVMEKGSRAAVMPGLMKIRSTFADQWRALPEAHKHLFYPRPYTVALSPGLNALQERIGRR